LLFFQQVLQLVGVVLLRKSHFLLGNGDRQQPGDLRLFDFQGLQLVVPEKRRHEE
jgi:hypothetical protein